MPQGLGDRRRGDVQRVGELGRFGECEAIKHLRTHLVDGRPMFLNVVDLNATRQNYRFADAAAHVVGGDQITKAIISIKTRNKSCCPCPARISAS
jgi:hypothetical protein